MNKERTPTSKSPSNGEAVPNGDSADQLTRRNVEVIRKLEEANKEERKPSDLVAEAIATSAVA